MDAVLVAVLIGAWIYYVQLYSSLSPRITGVHTAGDRSVGLPAAEACFLLRVPVWVVALIELRVRRMIEWEFAPPRTLEVDPMRPPKQEGSVSGVTLRRTGVSWSLGPIVRDVMARLFPAGRDECDIGSWAADAAETALRSALSNTLSPHYFRSGMRSLLPGLTLNALGVVIWTAMSVAFPDGSPVDLWFKVFMYAFFAMGFVFGAAFGKAVEGFSLPRHTKNSWEEMVLPILVAGPVLLMVPLPFSPGAVLPMLHCVSAGVAVGIMSRIPTANFVWIRRQMEHDRSSLEAHVRGGDLKASEVPMALALGVVDIDKPRSSSKREETPVQRTARMLRSAEELLQGLDDYRTD